MALDYAKHKNILIKILKDIFTDPALGPYLGFKGGTAALLFYDLNRFSVDLDFDLLDAAKEAEIFAGVKKIMEKYGRLKEARVKRFNLVYILDYDDRDINAQNVKVEINRRNFGSKYEVRNYLGIAMKVMVRADMAAHKLAAMLERVGKTNRDIFDVWFFLHNDWPVNQKIVEDRTKMSWAEFLAKSLTELEKINRQDILAGMGELLDNKQKAWVKTKLLSETIFLLRLNLANTKETAK